MRSEAEDRAKVDSKACEARLFVSLSDRRSAEMSTFDVSLPKRKKDRKTKIKMSGFMPAIICRERIKMINMWIKCEWGGTILTLLDSSVGKNLARKT